jgi:UDP-N-acetylglucosamine transferase subunit ALG13
MQKPEEHHLNRLVDSLAIELRSITTHLDQIRTQQESSGRDQQQTTNEATNRTVAAITTLQTPRLEFAVQCLLCLFTALAFLAAAWYAHVASQQRDTMDKQLTAMREQAYTMTDAFHESQMQSDAIELSADATRSAAETADKTLRLMKASGEETTIQIGRLIAQQQRSADAADKSFRQSIIATAESEKQSKRALDASIEASHAGQRPILMVTITKKEFLFIEVGKKINWNVGILNHGKTPANHASTAGDLVFGPDAMARMERFFKEFNPNQKAPIEGIVGPVLGNGDSETPGSMVHSLSSDKIITVDDLSFIETHDAGIVIFGVTQYEDVFGTRYRTDFCLMTTKSGAPMNCPTHNEVK